jgi:radical SAM protein with 4Fe4S-binding SPASM domain
MILNGGRGRPSMTWKRIVAEEARKAGKTWKEARALAQNRVCRRCFVKALCSGEE